MVPEIGKEKIEIAIPIFRRAPFEFQTMGVPVAKGKFKLNTEILNFEMSVDALGQGARFIIGGKFYSMNMKDVLICLCNKVAGKNDFFEYRFSEKELHILDMYMAYVKDNKGKQLPDRKTAMGDMLRTVFSYFELEKLIKEDQKNGEKKSEKG